jgi:hypothetical protein
VDGGVDAYDIYSVSDSGTLELRFQRVTK